MCGIVGILGRSPVAELLVDSLKRLEYRGYDSAGVATLEGDHLARRRAEGKLKNLEKRLAGRTAGRPYRDRPHPLGYPRQADRKQRASACDRKRCRGPQRHHREFSRLARDAREEGRKSSRARPTPKSCCSWSIRSAQGRHQAGGGGEGRSLSQLRGAFALGIRVQRRRRSDDRRPQRSPLAIGHGDGEMYLGSDAIALASVHRHHQLSRRRRLGGAVARRA